MCREQHRPSRSPEVSILKLCVFQQLRKQGLGPADFYDEFESLLPPNEYDKKDRRRR